MKFYWKVPNSDSFTNASEWTPSAVPGALDQAFLTGTGTGYDVNVLNGDSETVLTISTSADAILNIIQNSTFTAEDGTGSGANNGSIHVEGGSGFSVAGTINNPGSIALLGTNSARAFLSLLGDTTLNGGTLTLNDASGENTINGVGTLTNTGNSIISGAGEIDVAVNNKATGTLIPMIEATGSAAPLVLNGTVTNTGQLIGGDLGLVLANTVNNVGGVILANDLVELDSLGTIIGGTIEGVGTFLVLKGALDGGGTHPITVNGKITVEANDSVDVQGAFKTPASAVFSLLTNSSLLLGLSNTAAADTTFSGGGQIVLISAGIDLNPSTHVGSAPPKLNNVDDIITGTGTIGDASTPGLIVLNNEAKGTVQAHNGSLTIYSNVTNAGVLDATNGTLELFENAITNTMLVNNVVTNSGSLKAEAGAQILLLNTTIHGGTLTGAGTFEVGEDASAASDDAVLDGSTAALTNGSTIDLQATNDINTLTLLGTINNTNTIELGLSFDSGGIPTASDLVIGATGKSNTVTLKGSGTLLLDGYGSDYIIGDANLPGGVPTTLNNLSTIEGSGRIGDSGLTLKNGGAIVANGSSPLVIDTGARTVTNTGTLEGFNFSTLYIDSPLNDAGGKLVANFGEVVAAQGASGGTATLDGGGTMEFGGPTTTAVVFSDNGSHSAELVLDDSVHFKGLISGFAKNNINDEIDLNDIDSATAHKVSYSLGVLTIKDNLGHTAQLHFSGTYTLAGFNLNPDGNGGTLLTDPPAAPPANAALFGSYMASAFPSTAPFQGAALDLSHPAAVPLLAAAHA